MDAELYLPEAWTEDASRCEAAGIPEDLRELRAKGEMALDMVRRLRREGLHFSFVAFDGGYGHLPWLLRELDGEGEIFLAEVRSDQAIHLDDPAPAVPARHSSMGQAPRRLQTHAVPVTMAEWTATQSASQWRRLPMRAGEKGEVMAEYQVRRRRAWHHHMLLVMITTMFLAKERLALRDTAELLSCRDLVEIMRHKLPNKIVTDDDLATSITDRHQRRRQAMESAYRQQAAILAALH